MFLSIGCLLTFPVFAALPDQQSDEGEKKEVPDYSLVMGVPGQVVKSLEPEVAEKLLQTSTQAYLDHLYEYQEELKALKQA